MTTEQLQRGLEHLQLIEWALCRDIEDFIAEEAQRRAMIGRVAQSAE